MATVCRVLSFVAARNRRQTATISTPKAPSVEPLLAVRLMVLVGVPFKGSLELMLQSHFEASPDAAQDASNFLIKSLRLLGRLGHHSSEIMVCSVHAASYLVALVDKIDTEGLPKMTVGEFVRVFCLSLYVAHSHIDDATLKLKDWHSQLFRKYCSMQYLNWLLMSMLEKLDFKLRIDEDVLQDGLHFLQFGTDAKKRVLRRSKAGAVSLGRQHVVT